MIRWGIHRLARGEDGVFGPGPLVGEVVADQGAGVLQVFDESMRDLLEDLFENEVTLLAEREEGDGGRFAATAVDLLPPWQDETLSVVRTRLPRHGLVAVEREAAPGT